MKTQLRAIAVALAALLAPAVDAQTRDPAALPVPEWIWLHREYSNDEVVLFRKEFDVAGDVKSAVLFGSCDNQLRVYLNGDDVAASESWEVPAKENVTRS